MDFVSIIIPNLNSPLVGETLSALIQQDYSGDYEIIVVGQDCHGLIIENDLIREIKTIKPTPPAIARNIGIRNARGNILLFTDADCIPASNWISRLISHYKDPGVVVVGGGVEFPRDNYWTCCDNLSTFHEYLSVAKPGTRKQLPSLNLSLRKEAIAKIGLFDERYPLPAGEDADLTTRLRLGGYLLHFDPQAIITHHPNRSSIKTIMNHAYNFGKFSIQVDPRYKSFSMFQSFFRRSVPIRLTAFLLAAVASVRIFHQKQILKTYWPTIPIVYLLKMVWCWGASRSIKNGPFAE